MSKPEQDTAARLDEMAKKARDIRSDDRHMVYLNSLGDTEVYKCKAKNVASILEFVSYLMREMGIKSLGELPKLNVNDPTFFLKLISNSADRMFLLAAELSELDHVQVQELDLDDALKLITEIVALNKPFFFQSVLPLVRSALPSVQVKQTKTSEG